MKKLILTLLVLGICVSAYGADQWAKDDPLGTRNISDLDTYIGINNEALDRMLAKYRNGAKLEYASAAALTVTAGEISCSNADGSVRKFRQNTSSTSVTWANIDTGAEANSTTYYVYGVADTDATTFTIIISANSSTPQGGQTYYVKLGSFYNDGSGNIDRDKIYDSPSGALKANSSGQGFISSIRDFGTSASSYTAKDQWDLKVAYGTISVGGTSNATISNLPFTSASTYSCAVAGNEASLSVQYNYGMVKNSGTGATVSNYHPDSRAINWICIGH